MAKPKGKHMAKRGQVKKNKHLANRRDRKKRLYNLTDDREMEEVSVEEPLPEEPEPVPAPEIEPEEAAEEEAEVTEALVEEEAEEPEAEEPAEEAEEPEEEPETTEVLIEPKEAEVTEVLIEPEESEGEPAEEAEEPEEKPERTEPPKEPLEGKQLTFAEVFKEEEEQEQKKASALWKGIRIAAILIILAIVLCAGYVAADRYLMSPDKFQKDSSINNVDVSGLTEEQAEAKVRDHINSETLSIYENGENIGTIKDFEFNYDFGDKVAKCLHPGYPLKFTRLFKKEERDYQIKLTPINQDKNFNNQFKELDIVKHAKGTEATKNAYVDLSTHDFNIISEVYGDSVDTAKLKQAMLDSIGANQMEFQYDPLEFRLEPEIKANSKEIRDRREYCKKYLAQEVRLNTFKGPYTISPKDMNQFLKVDEQGNRVIKKKELKKFTKKLKENFTVRGGKRSLDLAGGHVEVSGGDYGVTVDSKAEYKQLKKDFATMENVDRDLLYEEGHRPSDNGDVGDSYVEIDISRQHLWCVIDGDVKLESDVVTGCVSDGHATPTGVYSIAYKVSPCTLRGSNADGSQYSSKVTYWMPFNGGIGCHDATWRNSFGGKIYKTSGSHGCVNMPLGKAHSLYQKVKAGMPVVVHD